MKKLCIVPIACNSQISVLSLGCPAKTHPFVRSFFFFNPLCLASGQRPDGGPGPHCALTWGITRDPGQACRKSKLTHFLKSGISPHVFPLSYWSGLCVSNSVTRGSFSVLPEVFSSYSKTYMHFLFVFNINGLLQQVLFSTLFFLQCIFFSD